MLQWVNSLSYFCLFFFLSLLIYSVFIFSLTLNLSPTLPSLSLHPAGVIFTKEHPSSVPCCIVHALPPICFPHSAAPSETLRWLKRQIAHTKKGEKNRERRKGQPFTAMQLSQHLMPAAATAGFCSVASALLCLPCTSPAHLIAMEAAIFTVQDINMATLPNNAHIQ